MSVKLKMEHDQMILFLIFSLTVRVSAIEWPSSCKSSQYYEPVSMQCHACPANASLVTSSDGFSCSCADHSVPSGVVRCRSCNVTDVVSSDGFSCVRRRCQQTGGKFSCRKCPNDYISVTQNFDGSPMREVLCVKCAKGYKAVDNTCTRCPSCVCGRSEVAVAGVCLPKTFVNERPKQEQVKYHPNVMMDLVKMEYLCMQNDMRACRSLANECTLYNYPTDLAGPCRMWITPNIATPTGLPPLTIDSKNNNKQAGELLLPLGTNKIMLLGAVHTSNGRLRLIKDLDVKTSSCSLPIEIIVGKDFSNDCYYNISEEVFNNETIIPYILQDDDLIPIPLTIKKTNGQYVQKGLWPSNTFRRYFLFKNILSPVGNYTTTVYLRALIMRLRFVYFDVPFTVPPPFRRRVHREAPISSSLRIQISIDAQYATKSLSNVITTTLKVEHDMPTAGILKGLEIWGGVLGSLSALYALAQWRGVVRRGGLYVSIVPLIAGCLADSLYFAALFSVIHALAAEAGALGITLPLSKSEEHIIRAFVISAATLKILKIVWFNFCQCRCDLFFLDWSEYNNSCKGSGESYSWHASTVAREWSRMQTKRRASPWFTFTISLFILQLILPWQEQLPRSPAYQWAVSAIAWWCSYISVVSARLVLDRVVGSPASNLPKVCRGAGLSLLVFQEELYAHYVHGRKDDSMETRSIAGPLTMCRVVCAPQLRIVYKQLLLSSLGGLGDSATRQALLSRFLAAFFERALDGLSWVASERTVIERLLDIEVLVRESGNTSTLLYDPESSTASCFAMTWWGEEWSLGTFDAMVFGCVAIVSCNHHLAILTTVAVWQILKYSRLYLGNRNIRRKTDIHIDSY